MNLTSRSLGLALLLLLVFLGATVTLQWWLRRETGRLQAAALEDTRERFMRAVAVSGRPPEQWDASFRRELGAMLGGAVEVLAPGEPVAAGARGDKMLRFVQDIPGHPDWKARVTFSPPAVIRVQVLHQRVMAALVVLALLCALLPMLFFVLSSRRGTPADGGTRSPWAAVRAHALGLEHLAKITNETGAALLQEHDARLRAEEDLQVNRSLLDRSVAERVRLGRELHDNICQTLYAVCLTLESVQKKDAVAPAMRSRIEQCLNELRRLNQQVRAYLRDLEPGNVAHQSFRSALDELVDSFALGADIQIERKLDEEALARIAPAHVAELMGILREALSNSLRHGGARRITLRAGRSDTAVALSVQDDGCGFHPSAGTASPGSSGHGLANMQARAAALGGHLHIDSAPGKGTRVLLTLPVASPA
jgi:signal transduction histidine kinase